MANAVYSRYDQVHGCIAHHTPRLSKFKSGKGSIHSTLTHAIPFFTPYPFDEWLSAWTCADITTAPISVVVNRLCSRANFVPIKGRESARVRFLLGRGRDCWGLLASGTVQSNSTVCRTVAHEWPVNDRCGHHGSLCISRRPSGRHGSFFPSWQVWCDQGKRIFSHESTEKMYTESKERGEKKRTKSEQRGRYCVHR